MILEDATLEAFGYFPNDLRFQSGKPIIAACDSCGKFRIARKSHYHTFCISCSRILGGKLNGKNHPMFGKHHSEETKTKISIAEKGRKSPTLGKHLSEETKAKMSVVQKGNKNGLNHKHTKKAKALMRAAKKGEKNPWFGKYGKSAPNFKGGKRVVQARCLAKRKRDFGYTLLAPVEEGEVGHHLTNEYVIGISKEVHQRFSGYKRRKHRTLVLNWLKANDKKKYKLALCVLVNTAYPCW